MVCKMAARDALVQGGKVSEAKQAVIGVANATWKRAEIV